MSVCVCQTEMNAYRIMHVCLVADCFSDGQRGKGKVVNVFPSKMLDPSQVQRSRFYLTLIMSTQPNVKS